MRGKIFLSLSLIFMLITIVNIPREIKASPTTKLHVNPPTSTATPGDYFSVDINVADVVGLYSYTFCLKWEGSLLNVTTVTEDGFLSAEGVYETFVTSTIWNAPDPAGVSNYVIVSGSLLAAPATAAQSGSGTLVTITFLVEHEGGCALQLYNTALLDFFRDPISHTSEDGWFVYPLPKLSVHPESIIDPTLVAGTNFTIALNITDAFDLYGLEFYFGYNTTMLSAISVTEGPFLKKGGTTLFSETIIDSIGVVQSNCSLIGDVSGVDGTGTVATIKFVVEARGSCFLDFYNATLVDSNLVEIDHETFYGTFINTKTISTISISVVPATVTVGDSTEISGSITPKRSGVDVTIQHRPADGTWTTLTTVATDENGEYSYDWTPTTVEAYEVKASWPGDESAEAAESVVQTLEVQAAPVLDILPYAVGGIVIVVIVVAIALYLRTRRKTEKV